MAASMASVTFMKKLLPQSFTKQFFCRNCRNSRISRYSTTTTEEKEDDSLVMPDVETDFRENDIERLRNFSNLPPHLRQLVHGKMPDMEYYEEMTFKDNSERKSFLRELYVRYGKDSNIDPGVCWPSKHELESTKLDDEILESSFQQMMTHLNNERKAEADFRKQLKEKVEKGMAKMDSALKAYNDKEQTELQKVEEAKLKKKVMLDEAEEHYGYPVKPNSVDFQNFMEMRREEEAKAKKLARKMKKKARISPMLQKVAKQS